jgi:hypothetical protein
VPEAFPSESVCHLYDYLGLTISCNTPNKCPLQKGISDRQF